MLVSGRVPVNAPENRPGTNKERQKVFQADKFPGGYVSLGRVTCILGEGSFWRKAM